jgi:hypothetical protein
MGNLSNQYISQSFQSLLHLGSDNTASATFAEIQDALGNGVGVFVATTGNLKVTNAISASAVSASTINGFGNPVAYSASVSEQLRALENITSSLINVTGSYATTGSNNFIGNQTISGDLDVSGQLRVTSIYTTQETSSVIFSSGSNILGDTIADTQTFIGTIIMSGSNQLTGSMGIRGGVSVIGAISSSTITGMGNVTNYSASVFNQFYALNQYDTNNDIKWTTLEPVTQSLIDKVYSIEQFTASAQLNLNQLNQASASTALTNPFTASVNTKFTTLTNVTSSLINFTGSAATTGSNRFIGTETITGSLIITGSAYGNVVALTISSNTASIDMSRGNFFTLTLASSATTRLEATNIRPGETANLLITQPATSGSLVLGSMFKTSTIYPYIVTASGSAKDLVSLISFDTASIYTLGANKMS